MSRDTAFVLNVAATLDTAANLKDQAGDRRIRGMEAAAKMADNGRAALLDALPGSPSIARLRAAVYLLRDLDPDEVALMIARPIADLARVLDAIDDGSL